MITLDDGTADRITLSVLIEHKKLIENQLTRFEEGSKWMHEDDVKYNKKLIKSLARVIRYFGGESYE